MTSRSKIKGNSWERDICKYLGSTLGGNFMRVPNSGAFVGGQNAHRKTNMTDTQIVLTKGDIIPPDNLPKMVIEAKSYADFAFHQLLTPGDCKQLDKWVEQTRDCVEPGDVWFTVFKINRKGSFVAFDKALAGNFKLENHVYYKDLVVTDFESFFANNALVVNTLCA